MAPKVAIIIVTYNGGRYIKDCLVSVLRNKYEGQFDILVVDNASQDNTVEIVKKHFPQVELIKLESNSGFVGGNNIGIKKALEKNLDYVVLLNQDTEVEYDWLSRLVEASQDNKVGVAQSMLLLAGERSLTNNVGNALHYLGFGFVKHYRERVDGWYHRAPFEIGYASGAALLVKREVLERVGLLDEKFFMYHEDLDLCWRARLAGYKIILAPQAVVYHHYQFNRNKKMFYWTERNRWACLLQNYSARTLLLLAPMFVFIEAAMLAYSVLSGFLWLKIKSYLWVILNLLPILSQRCAVQRGRQAPDREILKQMDSAFESRSIKGASALNFFLNGYYRILKRLI